MRKVAVIGGGAAGMMAAVSAADAGAWVTLYEKNEKLGKKLYITGKGRCNVTNACDREDFFSHIVSNPRFLYSAYGRWSSWDMMDFLEAEGLPLKTERGNRVFPNSDKSSDVIRTLQRAMERRGVRVHLKTAVKGLLISDRSEEETPKGEPSRVCEGLELADGRQISYDAVILATGGLSYPSTGSTGDGYLLAEAAGHQITRRYPALVPLEAEFLDGHPCKELQGLALKNTGLTVFREKKQVFSDFGELLFTHFGVSGPIILSASSHITAGLHQDPLGEWRIELDLKPALSMEQLDRRFLRELEAGTNKQLKNLLGAVYPARLVPVILRMAGVPGMICGREVTREQRSRLREITKALPLRITGTRGYPEAIITQGGVGVREIQPAEMASKKTAGLYLAGEILDLDASTGGFNLQIAWSTGRAAGMAAAAARNR